MLWCLYCCSVWRLAATEETWPVLKVQRLPLLAQFVHIIIIINTTTKSASTPVRINETQPFLIGLSAACATYDIINLNDSCVWLAVRFSVWWEVAGTTSHLSKTEDWLFPLVQTSKIGRQELSRRRASTDFKSSNSLEDIRCFIFSLPLLILGNPQCQCIHSDTSVVRCVWVDGTSWLNPPYTPPGGSLNLFLSCLTWAARHVALHSDLALHICLHQKSLQHKPNSSAQSSLFWLIHLRNLL